MVQVSHAKILYKRQLLNESLQGMWEYPLTVVQAPMGYGKTMLVREFLREREEQILWLTVNDASVAKFWGGFSQLFCTFSPACAHGLTELGFPGDNVAVEEAVELIGDLEHVSPTVIVIDDYHLLCSRQADCFFQRLIQSGIPNLHILIVSRSSFGENMAELLLKGYCLLIDKKDLQLSNQEIVEYCNLCGISLKAREAAFLTSYTEGWISAVYLCALGYLQSGHLEEQSADIYELIEKAIYQPCPPEIKEFLMVISMFDSFTLAQVEYVWRKNNAQEILTRITVENAFIFFDYASRMYRMHNILTGFLRGVFAQQDLSRRQAWWQRAGQWYLLIGEYGFAVDCFYQGADFDALLHTIETARGMFFSKQPKNIRIKYFLECTEAVKRRHLLACIFQALYLYIANEQELFIKQRNEVERLIHTAPELDENLRIRLRGELEILKGIASFNDITAMAEHFTTAWRLLNGPSILIDTKRPWTFGAPSVLFLYYRASGQLEAEVRTMLQVLPAYYRMFQNQGCGGEYVLEAERYYYIGDFDNAEIVAYKALHIAEAKRQTSQVLCAKFLLMRLALMRENVEYVLENLRQAREDLKEQVLYSHICILDLCEGFLFSCLDQEKRIPSWIAKGNLPDTLSFPCHAFFNIVWDKTLLIQQRYHQLLGVADPHIVLAGIFPNLLAQIYTYIFAAAAQAKLGRQKDALSTLSKAMYIAAPDQVMMPFVENGRYIDDLLIILQADGQYQDFINQIREVFLTIDERLQALAAKLSNEPKKSLLTERETEITELVAEGLSNQAVGKMLNITKDTVKKALGNIFAKLGVSNRTALTKIIIEQRAE